jgi:hypothetical protein
MLHNQVMHWIRVKSDEEYLLGNMSSVRSDFLDFLGIMHHTESGKNVYCNGKCKFTLGIQVPMIPNAILAIHRR